MAAESTSVKTDDEKQASTGTSTGNTLAIDTTAKGLESFNKYIQAFSKTIPDSEKFGFVQLSQMADLLHKCKKNGLIDANVDLDDIEEDEEHMNQLLDNLSFQTYFNNMEYLFISEKHTKAFQDIQNICEKITGDGMMSFENTHTGNLKADAFEKIVKKIASLLKRKDFEKSFGYALAFTYLCIDDDNGNAYWLNDNECTDEIDSNILKPLAKCWSKLLSQNCKTLGLIADTDDNRVQNILISYVKHVQTNINNTFEWYDEWNVKFPSN